MTEIAERVIKITKYKEVAGALNRSFCVLILLLENSITQKRSIDKVEMACW